MGSHRDGHDCCSSSNQNCNILGAENTKKSTKVAKHEEKQTNNNKLLERKKDHKIYITKEKIFLIFRTFQRVTKKNNKRLHVKDWKYKAQGKGIKGVTLKCLNMSQQQT